MAIQGTQNLSGITFNKGNDSPSTVNRLGDIDAFGDVTLTGYQQGGNVNFGTVNNYYTTTGTTGTTINNSYSFTGSASSGQFLNIESFGAVRNADSTTAIQNCINAAVTSGIGVYVPGYAYHITGTINFPYKMGSRFQGMGNNFSTIDNQSHPFYAGISRLVWYGATGGTMVCISGGGLTWDSVHLIGSPVRTTPGTGIIGILLSHDGVAGLGTTKAQFESITITNCEIGVSLARPNDLAAGNNDHCLWTDVFMYDCKTGFLIASEQAMGHHVHKFDFGLGWTAPGRHSAVVSQNGGVFYCDDFFGAQSGLRILEFIGPGPGHNNDNFVFRNVKLDNQALAAKLVDMSNWQPSGVYTAPSANIRFENVKISYTGYVTQPETYLVDIFSNVKLLLDNVDKMQSGALRLRGNGLRYPNVSMSNCRPWETITGQNHVPGLIHTGSSGTYYWRTHNMSSWSGVPFRDTGNYLL